VGILLWSELNYFFDPGFKFRFVPDTDFESKLQINVDMTVAMPCESIGADILDITNQNTFTFGRLTEEDTWFELDHIQKQHFTSIQTFNEYLREEYHALQSVLWKSGHAHLYGDLPPRRSDPDEPKDACRIHGSLTLNKVSGNFHITAGKSVPLFRGHAHLTAFMDPEEYNFTHRINKFSFGSPHGGIIQPLEGEEKISDTNMMTFQYFVQIVPTDIQSSFTGGMYQTYMYSVKDQSRPISHDSGSHGMPGIYFKYDMSALKVLATQDREPLPQFLVRLCAGVGGLVATSQILCSLIKSLIKYICLTDAFNFTKDDLLKKPNLKTAGLIPPEERAPKPKEECGTYAASGITLQEAERLIRAQHN